MSAAGRQAAIGLGAHLCRSPRDGKLCSGSVQKGQMRNWPPRRPLSRARLSCTPLLCRFKALRWLKPRPPAARGQPCISQK